MPADHEYVRFLNMAVEEQHKADEAASSGLQAESAEHLQRADGYREQAKAIVKRHNSKPCPPLPN
ncbi:hypothetical protein J2W40_003874 [Sphingobium xenophagum]|uniref:DUF4167 domain-containing protein n=2 Tax=Sphingobium xenophagum TaxID=121428 RepID=A0ABU1X7C6_SPHXE|nr:hypothetical protein [Sphingobium xenophagum]